MVKKPVLGLLIAVCTVILPVSFASAETVVRTGENIAIDASEVVAGDYYVSVGPLSATTMSGKVDGDMYALGGTVTVNGEITKDLFILGGSGAMYATVTDDVRIVAGEVTIGEYVGGDLFVIGGVLKVLSSATIAGDVIFYGGTADIEGVVKGSVLGASETIRIDGAVGKNVNVETVQKLTLGEKADIKGYVTYTSAQALERAQNATVVGEIQHIQPTLLGGEEREITVMSVLPLLIALFTTLALYLLFRRHLEAMVIRAQKHTLKTSLIGLAVLFFGPALCVLMLVTGLGLFIGLMALALFVFGVILSYVLSGVVFGSYLAKWFTNHPKVTLLWVVVGTLALQLMLFVPILGLAVVFAFTTITLGTLILGLYNLLS